METKNNITYVYLPCHWNNLWAREQVRVLWYFYGSTRSVNQIVSLGKGRKISLTLRILFTEKWFENRFFHFFSWWEWVINSWNDRIRQHASVGNIYTSEWILNTGIRHSWYFNRSISHDHTKYAKPNNNRSFRAQMTPNKIQTVLEDDPWSLFYWQRLAGLE